MYYLFFSPSLTCCEQIPHGIHEKLEGAFHIRQTDQNTRQMTGEGGPRNYELDQDQLYPACPARWHAEQSHDPLVLDRSVGGREDFQSKEHPWKSNSGNISILRFQFYSTHKIK